MKKTRKILSLFLALVLLSCCAGAVAEEEPAVIKIAGSYDNSNNPADAPLYQEIERRFNVKLEFDMYSKDAWPNRLTLMMAENNMPDMICNAVSMSKADADKYGAEGYFLNIADYLDYMPNFSAILENNPSYAAYVKNENGAIYGIHKLRDGIANRVVGTAFINQDWLDRLNLEVPRTIDELYNVLVAFRDNDADGDGDPNNEIPFSCTMDRNSGVRMESIIRSAFGIYSYAYNTVFQVGDDGKVYLAETTENWKGYVKFMNKLFTEKLLDNNTYIYSDGEYTGLLNAGNVGLYSSWNGVLQKELKATLEDPNEVYFHLHPFWGFSSDYTDGKIMYTLYNSANPAPTDIICADSKYPELMCQIVDFFFGEEGIFLRSVGIDGQTVVIEEGYAGFPVLTYPESLWAGKYASKDEWTAATMLVQNAFQYVVWGPTSAAIWASSPEEIQHYIDDDTSLLTLYHALSAKEFQAVDETKEDYPNLVFHEDEIRERSTLLTDITSYIATMKVAFITGEKDIDATWDEFQSTLKTMGLDRLLEIEQQAYDRYAANL